ncbi:hypothetical protein VT50_0220690 [Streptomyces antioxidans]|uniref:Uncharacterized protein n=1 Tax=Streptomyces antioxidans TaxID=1507734 RepID=A0A1V4D2E3_9ACTN|nr:hypothetical protein [Streptomyces antioxidans]OPF77888.1 hypothetical protein VT50_0220690 [Streptomyces antioxidans]
MYQTRPVRLLPWEGMDGKRCYLASDGGFLSRFADQVEAVQLGMGAELLAHADGLLSDHETSARELRFLAVRLTEALADALRIAESRGGRLGVTEGESPAGGDSDAAERRPETC